MTPKVVFWSYNHTYAPMHTKKIPMIGNDQNKRVKVQK